MRGDCENVYVYPEKTLNLCQFQSSQMYAKVFI